MEETNQNNCYMEETNQNNCYMRETNQNNCYMKETNQIKTRFEDDINATNTISAIKVCQRTVLLMMTEWRSASLSQLDMSVSILCKM